ncbi:MAG: hypothetical protein A2Y62_01700 [Candidatus Fischerbacteria bacterium RBG_13_37_8]|uniref:CRISPR type III-associated protein domain-containing protein n=1 Tax=Candidatus Fischerbacteria bacterium RBG_13_37_8 TaxID=1817863 RepID=A0A1F5VDQ9_9BACT|nr:MAG: hypothetical protein A2Y62_01700 [Candidatus Fischerbacteria bacterium RBG_13_37_8]
MGWNIHQNPYNFVRSYERIVDKAGKVNESNLRMHSCLEGHNGYVECELINKTPLFTGGVAGRKNQFLRINDRLVILSTSLKGMIRSFIEALTGSCLSNNFIDGRLTFRKPENWKFQTGKVKHVPEFPGDHGEIVLSASKASQQEHKNNKGTILFDYEARIEYENIMNRCFIYDLNDKKKPDDKNKKLIAGMSVYFQEENGYAVYLSAIPSPRIFYRRTIGSRIFLPLEYEERLNEFLRCSKKNPCTSCALFGYVDGNENAMGKVAFSHAIMRDGERYSMEKIELKAAGIPQPGACNMYLSIMGEMDKVRDYDGNMILNETGKVRGNQDIYEKICLRGRKYYWHANASIPSILKEQQLSIERSKGLVPLITLEVLKSQNYFVFKVYFKNCTDFELGLLLYALMLEENMHYKIGAAKYAGFGTIKINVNNLFIENLAMKYRSINTAYIEKKSEEIPALIEKFKKQCERSTEKEFDKIPAVEDLRIIMDITRSPHKVGYEAISDRRHSWYRTNKNMPLPSLKDQ